MYLWACNTNQHPGPLLLLQHKPFQDFQLGRKIASPCSLSPKMPTKALLFTSTVDILSSKSAKSLDTSWLSLRNRPISRINPLIPSRGESLLVGLSWRYTGEVVSLKQPQSVKMQTLMGILWYVMIFDDISTSSPKVCGTHGLSVLMPCKTVQLAKERANLTLT